MENKLQKKTEIVITKLTDRIDRSLAFGAIRQGMIMMIPLLVIGYVSMMVISLPIPVYQNFLAGLWDGHVVEIFEFLHSGVNSFFAVILAVTTSVSYGMLKTQKKNGYAQITDCLILSIITVATLVSYLGIQNEDFSINMFGNMHAFTALLVALIAGKLYFFVKEQTIFHVKKQGVNTENAYLDAVSGIAPAFVIILSFALFHQFLSLVFHVNGLQELLEIAFNHLIAALGNNFVSGLVIVIVTHLLWLFGIHGHNVLDTVIKSNFQDIHVGIFNKSMQDVFILMGGSGVVLCLVVAILLFAKNKSMRNIAYMAAPTVMFNISEIALFGIPVILNPIFAIPFLLVPVITYLFVYAAMYVGFVPQIVHSIDWTTPIFLSGYQATGSWNGAVLQLICLIIGVFLYRPFIKMYEKQEEKRQMDNVKALVKELQMQEENNITSVLTKRDDNIGRTARILADELKDAVKEKTLYLMYQPQINKNGICSGAEALLRWNHPMFGNIYPPLIVKLAKEKNILHKLDAFIMEQSAADFAKIRNLVDSDFKLSVNLTNASLNWNDFENHLEQCMKKYDICNEQFGLEITEQDAFSTSDEIIHKMERIKQKGHKFLIDDFGMGHTSLLYLQTGYFDVVKLDGALTKNVLLNETDVDIITSITNLGHSLGFMTVAEWVQSEEQMKKLKQLGCDIFQGTYYSKPLPLDEFIKWISNYHQQAK